MSSHYTVKTRLFIREPMRDKPITDVPGVGDATAKYLEEKEHMTKAKELYAIWLSKDRDKGKFDDWLKTICGNSNSAYHNMSLDKITRGFKLWQANYGNENPDEENTATENDRNRRNKRPSTENAPSQEESKKTRPYINNSNRRSIGDAQAGPSQPGPSQPNHSEPGASESVPSDPGQPAPNPSEIIELDVAVVAEDDKKLNETQTEALKKYLRKSILETAKEPNTNTPRFKKMCMADGVLQLSCEDEQSMNWLKATVANAPNTEGTKVTVKRKSDMPKQFKVALFIQDCENSVDDTLLLLNKQNEWAQINSWIKHSGLVKDSALFLEFWIPETVVPTLLLKGHLLLQLESVPVWFTASEMGTYLPESARA